VHSGQFTPGGYLSQCECETHCVGGDRTSNPQLPIVSPTRYK